MNLPRLTLKGRGILAPSKPSERAPRVARVEDSPEALAIAPYLAAAPEMARLLALLVEAQLTRDAVLTGASLARAANLLDSLGWDWPPHASIGKDDTP